MYLHSEGDRHDRPRRASLPGREPLLRLQIMYTGLSVWRNFCWEWSIFPSELKHKSDIEIDNRLLEVLGSAKFILDVGCGDGRLLNDLAYQGHRWVLGLDISDHGFTQARKTHHHLVECIECDARQIAFKGDQFEAVLLTFSLHHIEEAQPALKEICRVLLPGGMVLLGEWLVEDDGQPRDGCYRFTRADLEYMLLETGFQQVEIEMFAAGMALLVGRK